MAKLLPPLVEGTIPAFYSENGMVNITIPFSMNRAVNVASVKGFSIKVKTAQSSTYLYSTLVTSSAYFSLTGNSPYVILKVSDAEFLGKIKTGQFYKFQIAYVDIEDDVGYFSTVAVGKYTTKPSNIEILHLNRNLINPRAYAYTGVYENSDITEKVYSYKFNVYNEMGRLVYTTGDQLHNSENDTDATESHDSFDFNIELPDNAVYSLEYEATTINNLVARSGYYRIAQRETLAPEISVELEATLWEDDGFIEVRYIGDAPASGSFLLTRACSDTEFSVWSKVSSFRLVDSEPDLLPPFRDFTIEQGKTYQYAIVQYNSHDLYSNRLTSNKVYADFEHAYLYDGERQLKIKYNPKIASLKTTLLESKVDTIGSQYPFIFRNGAVSYKEFSISGLISLLSDENGLFLSSAAQASQIRESTPAGVEVRTLKTNLTPDNFYDERLFKMEVMNWLNNGKPKLFRSPGEGNYIVYLMNTSLAPMDQLGRMLHTFTSTAYEIAKSDYEALTAYNLLQTEEDKKAQNGVIYWTTVNFKDVSVGQILNKEEALTVEFSDMLPGEQISLTFKSGAQTIVTIGVTGTYKLEKETKIKAISLVKYKGRKNNAPHGYCIYSYENIDHASDFSTIANITFKDVPCTQLIGQVENSNEALGFTIGTNNQGHLIPNPKIELMKVYYIKAMLRDVTPIFKSENSYYLSPLTNDSPLVKPNPSVLYHVVPRQNLIDRGVTTSTNPVTLLPEDYLIQGAYTGKQEQYLDYNQWMVYGIGQGAENGPTIYYTDVDFSDDFDIMTNLYDTTISIYYEGKEHVIDLADIKYFYTDKITSLENIRVGSGVILEIGYQIKVIDYVIEEHQPITAMYRNVYLQGEKQLSNYLKYGDNTAIRDEYMFKLNQLRENYAALCQNVYFNLMEGQS